MANAERKTGSGGARPPKSSGTRLRDHFPGSDLKNRGSDGVFLRPGPGTGERRTNSGLKTGICMGGVFRNVEVITRPGSVLHALFPAPVVAGNTETSQRVVDVVFGALAKALPDKIPAASCGTMSSIALGDGPRGRH